MPMPALPSAPGVHQDLHDDSSPDVGEELAADLDEEGVLRRLAAHARAETGAEQVRLEVLGRDGEVLRVLDENARPCRRRREPGTLGDEVVVDGRPALRVVLLPTRARPPYDAEDAARLARLVRRAATPWRHARTHAAALRRLEACEVLTLATRQVDLGAGTDAALAVITKEARRLLGATGVGVLLPHPGGWYELRAADLARGTRARLRRLVNLARPALLGGLGEEDSGDFEVAGDRVRLVPVDLDGGERQHLAVWFRGRLAALDADERALVALFAAQTSEVSARVRREEDRRRAVLRTERERLARDLHDVVIQRIFAAGLHLKALARAEDPESARAGIEGVASDLDRTMEEIRSAVFELRHGLGPRLRDDVRSLAAEYHRTLGFAPSVSTEGDLDAVDPVTAEHLLATLRELFSNVARHADAGSCDVGVVREDRWLRLVVADDGRGIEPSAPRSGLENVRWRAMLLGGSCDVVPRRPAGTVVTWQVPVVDTDLKTFRPQQR